MRALRLIDDRLSEATMPLMPGGRVDRHQFPRLPGMGGSC